MATSEPGWRWRNLSALVCVRLNDPNYDQPTKSRLTTPRVQRIVKTVVTQHFAKFLSEAPVGMGGESPHCLAMRRYGGGGREPRTPPGSSAPTTF